MAQRSASELMAIWYKEQPKKLSVTHTHTHTHPQNKQTKQNKSSRMTQARENWKEAMQ